ncbi:MAG: Na-translocating system protein MpsC family protein [Silvibacterium sp.]
MPNSTQTMAEEIGQVAAAFQQQRTGIEPKSVHVVLRGDTLVVTLQGALSLAEQALAQSAEGAAEVQELHRQLFLTAFDRLRAEIRRITGLNVCEAAEVESAAGAAIQVLASGTMVQVFQLSGKLPPGDFSSGDKL